MMDAKYPISKIPALLLVLLFTSGCSQQARDRVIKADITGKAKEDVNLVGVRFVVE